MKQALRIILASALLTAAGTKAVPALAEPLRSDVQVSVVHTGDLDLSGSDGRRQLQLRLSQAAREVCGAASDFDLAGKNDVRRCRDAVLAKARSDSDALIAARSTQGSITLAAIR
ncbi:UrcA family protein [Sphingomonas sinipercae]|uniref:UrcA family protein n=1 Tax=Sphingomonas sinipercae TaxID=2714944 RepID=A0A6G7ZMX3_9SPHN|nr:UrcA family protein [Sphingomonas sinipercae]QIL02334.1 UrcA family protein [Sphingomonas sinipercae]